MKSNSIYNYVERLGGLLRADARQAGLKPGLQPVQLEALHYLAICNQFSDTPMAVTEYLGQTKGTVSQTLKVLEKKELLKKVADKKDKRVSHLRLTPKGQALLASLVPTQTFVNSCDKLNKKQRQQIEEALNLLLSSLLKTNQLKSFGVCHSCHYNTKEKDGGYFCNLVNLPLTPSDVQLICREHEAQ
ncbi:MAG: MarR family winged helix-turn-helix transcriptional regulator [Bermanella sp.]